MRRWLFLTALLPALAHAGFTDQREERDFVSDMQQRNGFDSVALLKLFHRAQPLPEVLQAIQPEKPEARSWQSYRARFVEPRRIAAGVAFWKSHRRTLRRAAKEYGVSPEIVVAIIDVETICGQNVGQFQTFSALATLAFGYPPRAELFRDELEALLLLAREEKRKPLSYRGSYAGAIGLPQFMPSSIRKWAVDFNGDGRIDLNQTDDAIGSVANFLAQHGWKKDEPILAPAKAEGPRIAELLAQGIEPQRTSKQLEEFGVASVDAPPSLATLSAALIDYVTPGAPTEYRLGYNNFYVITRYNRSSFYATAVYELAQAVKAAMSEN